MVPEAQRSTVRRQRLRQPNQARTSAAIRCERLTQLLRSVVDNALRSALAVRFARARSLAANSAAGLHRRGLLGDVRALALVTFDQAAVTQQPQGGLGCGDADLVRVG